VYGGDSALRGFCEDHDIGYVFEVACSFRVQLTPGRSIRADHAVPAKATLDSITARSSSTPRYGDT
jgi:hypothetical protein